MCLLSGLFILVMLENPCSVCAVLYVFTLCIYFLLLTPAWNLLVEAVWWDLICHYSMVTLACDVLTWLHTLPSKNKTFFFSVCVYMCACMDVVVTLKTCSLEVPDFTQGQIMSHHDLWFLLLYSVPPDTCQSAVLVRPWPHY
jgi:hypothetical protein